MDFQDKKLACKDCGNEFVWSAGEQKFYADKGLLNPPGRCQDCRGKAKKTTSQSYQITCKECGKQGDAHFEPSNPNDILCAACWDKHHEDTTGKQEAK